MDISPHAFSWYGSFLVSTIFHEAAHAYVGMKGGDDTAYKGGQVSLNPMPHIQREPVGMVVAPLITLAIMNWPIGYASAPYDPYWAQRYPKRASLMALAGPLANLTLACLAFAVIRLGIFLGHLKEAVPGDKFVFDHVVNATSESGIWAQCVPLLSIFLMLNVILFLFNMLPFPPLDGSGILPGLMSEEKANKFQNWVQDPTFSLVGILIAWHLMKYIFPPMFTLVLNLLYPGSDFGGY